MKNRFLKATSMLLSGILLWSFVPNQPSLKPKWKDPILKSKQWAAIGENLYVSTTEVSNIDFREFLEHSQADCMPDSAYWNHVLAYSDPLVAVYFNHPAFYPYPVVNISYDCANAYCEWLTAVYHQQAGRHFDRVRFRLPTEAEWEQAARGGLVEAELPWEGGLKNKKGQYRCNFRVIDQLSIESIGADTFSLKSNKNRSFPADSYLITAPVESFECNEWGLYNIAGNVSEMLAEEGKAKGGSWYSTGYHLQISTSELYHHPMPTLGFRVFMEVLD